MECPSAYKILLINNETVKLFAEFQGVGSTDWQVNSGTRRIDVEPEGYYFNGFSGSVYFVKKNSGIISGRSKDVLDSLLGLEEVKEISLQEAIDFLSDKY